MSSAFKVQVDARIEPSRARAITFEEAGRDEHFDRDAVLARAAARLSASDEEVARALFADRAERRRILAPVAPLSAADVVEQYNLALVQGLLQRSEHVRVEIREHVRAVVRFAKLAGLLCTYLDERLGLPCAQRHLHYTQALTAQKWARALAAKGQVSETIEATRLGITALGNRYQSPDLIDDTEMNLIAANAAERNGRQSEARGLLEGVLRGRLEAYQKLRGPTLAH